MDLLKKLVPFIKPHSKRLLSGLVLMAIFTVLSLAPPLLIRFLVNEIIQPKEWRLLVPLTALMVLVPLMTTVLQFGNKWLIRLSGFRMIRDIRMAIYSKVFSLSMNYHQENSSGLIVNRLMDDVNAVMGLVGGETVNLIIDIVVFIFSVSVVFTLSPILAGVLILIIGLYVLAYRHFSGRIRSSTTTQRFYYDRISERLEETVTGVRHVRIYNREIWENDQFLFKTNENLRFRMSSQLNSVSLSTVCTGIAGFGTAIIVSIGAYFVLLGRMQYGDVFAIASYIWMALNPAIRLTSIAAQLTETFVSVRRIFEILDEIPRVDSKPGAPEMERGKGLVEFEDVYFGYTPDIPLYKGLSIRIEPGMTVALVGHTGCGKTTFTSLLMRHWDIQSGRILVDGVDIRDVNLASLRRNFGVVLQDPIIFDGTLAENIAYGVRNARMESIEEAARIAEIYDLAMRLPNGLDTVIGTTGVKLSVGEKQRLSIARAILKDPVILIMDEATSSLDSESEALIQKALARILKGRTSFIVAHRLSTITGADRIVVMDKGAIVELGKHRELMAIEGGLYRQLYEELQGSVRTGAMDSV